MSTPLPAPDTAALMAQFNDLLLAFGNLAFDCGAYAFSPGVPSTAEYNELCAKKNEAGAELRRLFRQALSK